jgi:serine/threonine protein kinase
MNTVLLNKMNISDEQTKEEIMNEFEVMKQLDHPNIVKVHSIYEEKPQL